MASAEVQSRSPVTAAGGIVPNSLSASPAPNCTETIPLRIMAAGSAIPVRPVPNRAIPDGPTHDRIIRKWTIRDRAIRDRAIRDAEIRS